MKRRLALLTLQACALALLCGAPLLHAAGDPSQLTARTQDPRAYGYQVGDVITRDVTVHVPPGLLLDTASLPTTGRQGHAFELRQVHWQAQATGGILPTASPTEYRLLLQYQVFLSPPAVRTLELPPVTLHFTGTPRAQDLRIDAWPVTVAPLVPVEVSARRGLGDMQPDADPPLLDTQPARMRLRVYAAAATAVAVWLAHVYGLLPWLARRQRPFAQAWRALRALPADAALPTQRAALQTLHQALNRSAGTVLFEQGLADFLAAQPRYAPLQAELQRFFQLSRSSFFGPDSDATGDASAPTLMAFLSTLCRRCRDIERGTA